MKKTLLGLACAMCTLTASAQYAADAASTFSPNGDVEAWSGLRVSYDKTFLGGDWGDELDDEDFSKNGFSVGYEQAFKLSKSLPFFLQSGLDLNFMRLSNDEKDDDYSWEDKVTVLGLNLPVNFVYAFKINDMLALKPYTGFYVRVNVWGQEKYTEEYQGEKESEKTNVFDDSEDEAGDAAWNRVQAGWQIGTTLDIGKFNVGFGYALDFNELGEELKTSKFSVKVGCNF